MLGDVDAWKAEARPHRRDMFLSHISTDAIGACPVPVTYLTIRVPGATHMLPFQAPEAIVEAVLARGGAD